jgi:hypothetical protein
MQIPKPFLCYQDPNGDEYGRRALKGEWPAFDELVVASDMSAKIVWEPPLEFLESIWLYMSSRRGDEPFAQFTFSLSKFLSTTFRQNALCTVLDGQRAEFAACLGISEVTYGYKDVEIGPERAIIDFEFFFQPPHFTINTAPRQDEQALSLCKVGLELNELVRKACLRVEDLEVDVVSPAPIYSWPKVEPKVFLSHSSKDKEHIRKLAVALRSKRVDVWLDEEQIKIGDDFVKALERGLQECDFVVVLLSPNFLLGPWAQEEYRSTLQRQVESRTTILLPAIIQDCEVPPFLAAKRYADLRTDFVRGAESLASSVYARFSQGRRHHTEV